MKLLYSHFRYERHLEGGSRAPRKSIESSPQLTRSKTAPYDKTTCFFCDGKATGRYPLHRVSTGPVGESLNEAIKVSGNDILRVKLSTAVDSNDAHAIDIQYHKKCWSSNVTNVLRRRTSTGSKGDSDLVSETAARIEFLAVIEITLREGNIRTLSEVQTIYDGILGAHGVPKDVSRRSLKTLLQSEIPDIEFHKPKKVNEPDRISIKDTRDAAIQIVEDMKNVCNDQMKGLYDAAATLRKVINKAKGWTFTGTLDDGGVVPEELYWFCRWLIQGSRTDKLNTVKTEDAKKRAMSLSQTAINLTLTNRQTNNEKSKTIRLSRETPQSLAVGLAVHQATRSKDLVNMLHGFGMAVEYNRVLRVESQIEATVLNRMEENRGVYIPPDFVKGRHVFFAIDNVDFAEDTYDGHRTLHGAAIAIYQKKEADDEHEGLR